MTKSGDYPDPSLKVGIKDPVRRTRLPPPPLQASGEGGGGRWVRPTGSFIPALISALE